MKLVTSAQMRAVDHETIVNQGIPGPELMENAGKGTAEGILELLDNNPEETTVVIFCGKGNNGGDGFVVGRYLHQEGVNVVIFYLGTPENLSPDAKLNFESAQKCGLDMFEVKTIADLPENLDCDIVVDALFGTGFEGTPRGLAGEIIEYINRQEVTIVAVDMPSGLNADNGRHEGAVIEADCTFTMALPKYGLYLSPGRELSGVVEIVPIGVPDMVVEKFNLVNELITPDDVIELLPERKPDGHKGDFGKLFILAGSNGLTGAAVMAGESAVRSGVGLIKVGCPKTTQPVLAIKLTEVMTVPLPDVAKKGALALRGLGEIRQYIEEHDAVIIGPGLGRHHETFELVRRILSRLETPAIIDADGLNALAGHLELIKNCPAPLVLTPHPGEFKNLMGEAVPDDYLEKADLVRKYSSLWGVVIVLKGSPTLVAAPDNLCYFNQTGNSGMATGGSGDVLSGIIGSFLAQGMKTLEASLAGVFIHGLAGDLAAEALTERAMKAGDIIDYLPRVFQMLGE